MWAPSTQVDLGAFAIPIGAIMHAPQLSPDGLQLFFAMQDMAGGVTMFYATRSTATATGWNLPAPVIYADAGFSVTSIAWGPGTHVVVGTVSSTAAPAIYDATFDLGTKTLENFMMIKAGVANPYLTADGMNLYFDAMNTGSSVVLFVASRRNPTEAFAPAVQLTELANGDSVDTSAWVPAGGHTIYFASQRNGATMPSLYQAQRTSF
jgi:Tol biopolymer transport system component